jgi:hypothetical protein
MKKIIFILITIISIIFTSCNAPTEIKTISADSVESTATFEDFFNPVVLVYNDNDETSMAIVMDKNTGVLYVWKRSGYKWGMSPIYDSDGSVLTKEKWLARRTERND